MILQNKRIVVFEDEAVLIMSRFIYAMKQLFIMVKMPFSWYNETNGRKIRYQRVHCGKQGGGDMEKCR